MTRLTKTSIWLSVIGILLYLICNMYIGVYFIILSIVLFVFVSAAYVIKFIENDKEKGQAMLFGFLIVNAAILIRTYDYMIFSLSNKLLFFIYLVPIAIIIVVYPLMKVIKLKHHKSEKIMMIVLISLSGLFVSALIIINLNCRIPSKVTLTQRCPLESIEKTSGRRIPTTRLNYRDPDSGEIETIRLPVGYYALFRPREDFTKVTRAGFLGISYTEFI